MYGHVLESETRSILVLLEIAGVQYEFNQVDIIYGSGVEKELLDLNPSLTTPMLVHEDSQIMGAIGTFVNYLSAICSRTRLQHLIIPRSRANQVN